MVERRREQAAEVVERRLEQAAEEGGPGGEGVAGLPGGGFGCRSSGYKPS